MVVFGHQECRSALRQMGQTKFLCIQLLPYQLALPGLLTRMAMYSCHHLVLSCSSNRGKLLGREMWVQKYSSVHLLSLMYFWSGASPCWCQESVTVCPVCTALHVMRHSFNLSCCHQSLCTKETRLTPSYPTSLAELLFHGVSLWR